MITSNNWNESATALKDLANYDWEAHSKWINSSLKAAQEMHTWTMNNRDKSLSVDTGVSTGVSLFDQDDEMGNCEFSSRAFTL